MAADRYLLLALSEVDLLRAIRENKGFEVAKQRYLEAYAVANEKNAPKVQRSTSRRDRGRRKASA